MHCVRISRHSVLRQLDPIHHQGLHISLGAFRTSPALSLYMEAHEPSLTSRHLKLSLNFVLKLKYLLENPAENPSVQLHFRTRKHQIISGIGVENSTSRHQHSTAPGKIQNYSRLIGNASSLDITLSLYSSF